MSLFKRGNTWWAYVWIDGVRHHKSTGTANRRKAESIERQFRDELNDARQRLPQLKPTMTFGELAARFIGSGMGNRHRHRYEPQYHAARGEGGARLGTEPDRPHAAWGHPDPDPHHRGRGERCRGARPASHGSYRARNLRFRSAPISGAGSEAIHCVGTRARGTARSNLGRYVHAHGRK